MKQKVSTPVVIGIVAVVLVAVVYLFLHKGGDSENDGVDLKKAEQMQMKQYQQMKQASPGESEKAYNGK